MYSQVVSGRYMHWQQLCAMEQYVYHLCMSKALAPCVAVSCSVLFKKEM
jgi:hypothetical protein